MGTHWKYGIWVILLGVLTATSLAQEDPNLEGWWKLDGDALDYSGNERHGTLVGDAQFIGGGVYGGALSLDGSGDYVTIDGYKGINAIDDVQQEFTVANWFRTTSTSGDTEMVTWGTNSGQQRLSWRVHEGRLRTEHGSGNLRGNTYVNDGEWHHGALVVTEGANLQVPNTRLYVDGVQDTTFSGSNNVYLLTANADVSIGRRADNNSRYWPGDIDEVRIYSRVLSDEEIEALASWPIAHGPMPADGAAGVNQPLLQWQPRTTATARNVYLGTSPELTEADLMVSNQVPPLYYHAPGLQPGTTYYWRVDEIDPDGTVYEGNVWSFFATPIEAWQPTPADGASYVDPNLVLNWSVGRDALTYDLYFGTDQTAVAEGTDETFQGNVVEPNYATGALELETTYYWRADGVDSAGGIIPGDVWSFTTLPDIPVEDPNLLAWWTFDEGVGPRAVDWSGYNNHAALLGPGWLTPGWIGDGALDFSLADGVAYAAIEDLYYEADDIPEVSVCAWVRTSSEEDQYIVSFDRNEYYRLEINGNGGGPGQVGWDVMTSTGQVDYGSLTRVDDGLWHHLTGVFDNGVLTIYIDGQPEPSAFGGVFMGTGNVRYGLLGANSEATGFEGSRGSGGPVQGPIDDVRIYDRALAADEIAQIMRGDPLLAWDFQPTNGRLVSIWEASTVRWQAGDMATEHDVYFGTDPNAVRDANAADTSGVYRGRQNGTTYTPPEGVEWGQSYYWRIDEVNTDGTITEAGVRTFTVTEFITIDDFEGYTDAEGAEIFSAWIDGFDDNDNGSLVGHATSMNGTFGETTIVRTGGQSMPFFYDNASAPVSEATYDLPAGFRDWTANGIQTLALFFRGEAGNGGRLYVKINDEKVSYPGSGTDVSDPLWRPFNVDLSTVSTNLTNVRTLTVGVDGGSASGVLYIDDVRLYRQSPELIEPIAPDDANLAAYYALDGNVDDSSGNGFNGTANGAPTYGIGMEGEAIQLDGFDDHVVIESVGIDPGEPRTVSGWAKADSTDISAWTGVFGFTGPSGGGGHFDLNAVGNGVGSTLGYYGVHRHGWQQDILPIDLEWHHLAATYDGTTVSWYGDGVRVGSEEIEPEEVHPPGPVHIGMRQDNGNVFPGMVDEVRIYDHGLSDEEIAWLAGVRTAQQKPF